MKKWMLLLMSVIVAVVVAGAIAGFTLGDASDSRQNDPAGTSNSSGDQPADGWRLVDTAGWSGGFSLWLPPDWQLNELQGIDSYVGEIVVGDARLTFDLGWYSSSLVNEYDPLHVIVYEEVGGRRAKLVRPKSGTEGELTGVYFENFDSNDDAPPYGLNRLQISCLGLAPEQQETAFAVFRTIRLTDSEENSPTHPDGNNTETSGEQRPVRSDEAIDPNECDWVHDINACKKGDVPQGGDVTVINPDYSSDTPVSNDGVQEPIEEVPDHDDDDGRDSPGFTGPVADVRAPIEDVEVIIRESFPPQYAVRVVSGLPSGCTTFGHISVDRGGDAFLVDVFNLAPAGDDIACPAIYGTVESIVELGTGLEPGETYSVRVNDKVVSFVAQ